MIPMGPTLRVATFNVNSVRARLPILDRWLSTSGVEMLFLQETKATDEDFPAEAFAAMGRRAYFKGEKAYNGVAALVREEIEADVSFGFDDGAEPTFSTRVLTLRTEGLTVLDTYVPQGKSIDHPDFEVKKTFLDRVRRIVEREISGPFLWLGDMNVAPTELDVAQPKGKDDHVCFCAEIRERFARTADGLTDLLRVFHPEGGQYSFFDYRVKGALERGIGWRVDLMMASPSLVERVSGCHIDTEPRGWERPSDHTPVVVDVEM